MIDLRILRDDPELVRASQRARGADPGAVDRLLTADVDRRAAVAAGDSLRAEQKAFGRTIGKAAQDDGRRCWNAARRWRPAVKAAEAAEDDGQRSSCPRRTWRCRTSSRARRPAASRTSLVIKHVGEPPEFDFEPRDHLELGEGLGAIDMERGAKVSGARFYFLRGVGAQLQWAHAESGGQQGDRATGSSR